MDNNTLLSQASLELSSMPRNLMDKEHLKDSSLINLGTFSKISIQIRKTNSSMINNSTMMTVMEKKTKAVVAENLKKANSIPRKNKS